MDVSSYLKRILASSNAHLTLIDPEKITNLPEKIKHLDEFGTHAFLVGGSTVPCSTITDNTIQQIKDHTNKPVILFPNGIMGLSAKADALFFMSLINSSNAFWRRGVQIAAAPLIKTMQLETIPVGYIIVEPGMAVGEVGEADCLKAHEQDKASAIALASEYFGAQMIYLDAGSGSPTPVSCDMIRAVKQTISIPLVIGGGINTPLVAKQVVENGADIVVTGTIIENKTYALAEEIIRTIIDYRAHE